MRFVVFTDMDGTLIDHDTYSYEAALPALAELRKRGVPLVVCTSKTRAEIERFRGELGISDPFISENGGAIFIPKKYFKVPIPPDTEAGEYLVMELGTPYADLRDVLKEVEETTGCKLMGFGDMTAQEVSQDSGLGLNEAELSKMREYDEPFKIEGGEDCVDLVLKEIETRGLNYTRGGRYYHIMGDNDKGRAVTLLVEIFRHEFGDVTTIGLGDGLNDLPMLESVDIPVLVQKPDGTYEQTEIGVRRAEGVGPIGWNRIVMEILE